MYSPAKPEPMTTASRSRVAVDEAMWRSPCSLEGVGSARVLGGVAGVTDGAGTDGLDHLLEAALAARQEQDGEEPVGLALVAAQVDRDTRFPQPLRVGLALVAQDVVLGGEDDGGRQPAQVGGAQRRGVGF